ncbi:MAG: hypothetical protein KDC33_11020 [Thermoleophilia bacterium]|nr:hypothetical protein [Thermoleophilia bacterium]
MAPPPALRIDRAAAPARSRVGLGPGGLRLEPAGSGDVDGSPWDRVALVAAGPVPCQGLDAAQGGALVVAWAPGVVRSVRTSDAGQLFDRRPPGADRAMGAADANAGLLHAGDGWRAVVLPSLGDRVAALGEGPVAISPDGLTLAVADPGGVSLARLADGSPVAAHGGGPVDAVALGADDAVWVARGAAVGPAGTEPADGSRVVMLRAAAAADAAAALHEDGGVTVCGGGTAERWQGPAGTDHIAVSPDGAWVLLAGTGGVTVHRAADGAVALEVVGARAGALLADHRIAIGGEWGLAVAGPVADDA